MNQDMSTETQPPKLEPGQEFHDRYVIESQLGEGGMGVLYLASHKTLPRKFVIKIIRLAPLDIQANVALRRFKREARSIARIEHPNVVSVVDYDVWQDRVPFIIMDYVEGETLQKFIKKYPDGLPIDMVHSFMFQLCDAMQVVHDAGIIHRDLKPTNIMVQSIGNGFMVKILDFGLAHLTTPENETTQLKLTTAGQLVGTPYYMAPEQCREQEVTPRTDIYALGLLAYEMLAGHPAVNGQSFFEVLKKQIKLQPQPLNEIRSDLPASTANAIAKALEKEPEKRVETMAVFQSTFSPGEEQDGPSGNVVTGAYKIPTGPFPRQDQDGSSSSAIPWWAWVGAVLVVGVLAWFALS